MKFSFKQSVKIYIEPVNCSVTRLHCRLNIFFACAYIYIHTGVYVYVCDYVTYAIQIMGMGSFGVYIP